MVGFFDRKKFNQNGKLIPCKVVAYAYDEGFIIVAQKPEKNCHVDRPEVQNTGYAMNFWIAVHSEEKLIGPLSFEEYMKQREQLGVPDDLIVDVKI